MAVTGTPRMVTDGLVLCLDAANVKSYPGSGTTWTDLSSTATSGSLTNGPTFSSVNNGVIVFDGTNDYIDMGDLDLFTLSNGFTFDAFFKPAKIISGGNPIIEKYPSTAGASEYVFGFTLGRFYTWVTDTNTSNYRGRYVSNVQNYVSENQWGHFCSTYNGGTLNTSIKIYINSVQRDDVDFGGGTFTSIKNTSNNLTIADNNWGMGGPITGSLSSLRIYNRALSAAEVLQNYEATRERFGL